MCNLNKQEFLENIGKNTIFDNSFFKKVYGYSFLDKAFLATVAKQLNEISRKDIIQSYNNWLSEFEHEQSKTKKNVASWYVKECEKKYIDKNKKDFSSKINESIGKPKTNERSSDEWQRKKKELLLQKKKLIIMQNLQQSIKN